MTLSLGLATLHHADQALRVDHGGWPFQGEVPPFTVSLLAYPVILFALLGPLRMFWWRWLVLALGTGVTLMAHVDLAISVMSFDVWTQHLRLDPGAAAMPDLPDVHTPVVSVVAVVTGLALDVTAGLATVSLLRDGLRLRPKPRVARR